MSSFHCHSGQAAINERDTIPRFSPLVWLQKRFTGRARKTNKSSKQNVFMMITCGMSASKFMTKFAFTQSHAWVKTMRCCVLAVHQSFFSRIHFAEKLDSGKKILVPSLAAFSFQTWWESTHSSAAASWILSESLLLVLSWLLHLWRLALGLLPSGTVLSRKVTCANWDLVSFLFWNDLLPTSRWKWNSPHKAWIGRLWNGADCDSDLYSDALGNL